MDELDILVGVYFVGRRVVEGFRVKRYEVEGFFGDELGSC